MNGQPPVVVRSNLPTPRLRDVLVWLLLLTVGLGVLLAAQQLRNGSAAPTDTTQVEAVVQGGMNAVLQATNAGKGLPASGISESAMRLEESKIPNLLAQFYTGEPLARDTRLLQAAVESEIVQGIRNVDGGVLQIDFTSVSTTAAEATVTVHALTWQRRCSSWPRAASAASRGWSWAAVSGVQRRASSSPIPRARVARCPHLMGANRSVTAWSRSRGSGLNYGSTLTASGNRSMRR